MRSTLTALLGHLRQQNMITEMHSTCPKVAEICWLSCHPQHHGFVPGDIALCSTLQSGSPTVIPQKCGQFSCMLLVPLQQNLKLYLFHFSGFDNIAFAAAEGAFWFARYLLPDVRNGRVSR